MYIYGKNVAKEALLKDEKIKKAYLYKNFQDYELKNLLIKKDIDTKYVEKRELDALESGNHQGIILEVADYDYASYDDIVKENVIVILDHLEDPHNFGSIIRTCEAAGIKSIIIPKDRSVKVNGTVAKVSVGTIENVNILMVSNLVNVINDLKKDGYWIVGTDMQGTDYRTIDYRGKIVIIIGNEGKGMSRLVKENCDFIATIPMRGEVNSLNAGVAGALIIYEVVRHEL